MITVKQVKTRKEQREFVKFPLKLYKNNEYFVPCLYMDELAMFHKNFVYNDQAESIFFNAYIDGKMVGRIQGILQHASNQKWNQKRVRFTRFDSIDNQDVANALFQAIEDWAISKGMDEVVGPLGYSDLEREGLLIEGFDQLSTFEEQYNYPYYQKLIENNGYVKEVDWLERKIYAPKEIDPKFEKLCSLIMRRYKLHFSEAKSTSEFIKKYADQFFEIVDSSYSELYQTVPFTEKTKKMMINNFKLIVDIKYVSLILDENDKVVCFALCFPSIAKPIQKCKGHLNIFTIPSVLKALKNPEVIDFALIGVVPEYRMKGVASILLYEAMKLLSSGTIKYAETNLNLEDNHAIQNQWKSFESEIHKRRQSFVKKI